MSRLKEKVAFVTGAGGTGRAVCERSPGGADGR